MNLGFYIHSTSDTPLNKDIYNLLNDAVENELVDDASLFFNDVDFNPNDKKFGTFNSTDLWSFSGTLVVTSLDCLPLASSVVNKIKLIYLYCQSEFRKGNTGHLMQILSMPESIPIVAKSEQDKKEFFRLTKRDIPAITDFNAKEFLKV